MFLSIKKIIAWPICLFFLLGFAFAGSGQVLCIGDNGHIEIKTFCIPCCDEVEESCEIDFPDDLHKEHGDCSNCSDVELNSPLWSSRIQNDNPYDFIDFSSVPITNGHLDLKPTYNNHSSVYNFHLAFGQSPPSYSIETAILRC